MGMYGRAVMIMVTRDMALGHRHERGVAFKDLLKGCSKN